MNGNEVLRQRLIELAAAFALLTRLPVRFLALPRLTVASQAVWAYPVVGAIIGIIGGAAYWLVYSLSVPPALAAICALLACHVHVLRRADSPSSARLCVGH